MIFRRALINELVRSVAAVFLVLIAITLVTMIIRLLGDAASGNIAPDTVAAYVGFRMLHYLPVVLSLTLFIAVLMTLTRCYRDSEMVIWFASGISLTAWIRPVLLFIAPVVAAIAVISLALAPWAERKAEAYQQQIDRRNELAALAPGVFRESPRVGRVYFVESLAGGTELGNVFVQSQQNGRTGVMVAQRGYRQTAPDGDHFIVLENGTRYEGHAGQADYRVFHFDRYALRLEPGQGGAAPPQITGVPTLSLLRQPTPDNAAELQWRLSEPISALLLALVAIPMSFVNPRSGRSMNLIAAILIFTIYGNVLGIVQAWIQQGRLSGWIGLWPVHALMLGLVAFLFRRRVQLSPLLRWRR